MGLSNLSTPKRGYLANILTIPPLVYPFQYNPAQISESKSNRYRKASPLPQQPAKASGAVSVGAAGAAASGGGIGAMASGLKQLRQALGQTFSKADLLEIESEGGRTITVKFIIDGREKRAGEPERRRDDSGSILGDLAIIHSFVYPQMGDLMEIMSAAAGGGQWSKAFFNKPPTCLLVMGGTSIEGFVTELKITETLFNSNLDPTRAEVEMSMIENIDSISFIIDSVKRIGRTFYHTAYEDIGKVLF